VTVDTPLAPVPAAGPRRRGRTAALAGLALVAAGAGVAAVVLAGSRGAGPPHPAASHLGAVAVQRRTLVQRDAASAKLGYADARSVLNRLRGSTFTWLPKAGTVVARGHRLFSVDGMPVVLMYGSVPAYRPLAAGVADGADVAQLQRNLLALGFGGGDDAGHFGAETKAAVERWQDALGVRATGAVELGRVAFLPGARRVGQVSAVLGAQAMPGAVMKATATRQVVTVNLGVDKQSVARDGARVRVTLPDERVVPGRVTSVGDVAQGQGSQATIPVTVRLTSRRGLRGLDQAPVSVAFAKAIARHVLAVPVTALMARAGGTYAVVVVDGARRRTVAVTPGLFADGHVQVDGRGLQEGMRVDCAQ
jgi:membrane fusion protein, multidrug efflux system